MKTKDKKELMNRNIQELRSLLRETKEALENLRLDKIQMTLKNPKAISEKKKDVAQISTALREKELKNAENV